MKKNGYVLLSLGTVAAMGLAVLSLISTSGGPTSHARLDGNASGRAAEVASRTVRGAAADWGKLPLRFEANAGQVDGATQFVARGPGYNLLLGGAEATLVLERPSREALPAHSRPQDRLRVAQRRTAERAIVRMEMVGANAAPAAEGLERLQTETNYFIGDDPSKWHRNVPNYGRVKYREVYPGVDVIYYGKDQRLEYDLVVAAGANAKAIRMRYTGAESLRVDGDGALVLRVKGGDVRELRPRAYQTVAGVERPVEARYVLKGNEVEFALGEYDRSQALVIDPALVFSTYFGGNGTEFGFGIAVDGTNNVYLAGSTTSTNLPVTTTIGPVSNAVAIEDVFVVKLNATATAVTYCDYIGGSNFDEALTIAVDGSGNAFIGGDTASSDFPGTAGNAQPAFNGTVGATTNGWLAELNAAGTMLSYATYLGGNGSDAVNDLTIDGSGVIYATGFTTSSGATPFPTTAGAFQTTYGGPAVTPVTGDAFVAKVNPALAGAAGLVYSTYVGGSGDEQGQSIVIDGSGNAYIAGDSNTLSGFPAVPFAGVIQPTPPAKTVGGGPSGFVAELNAAGSALTFFTYLGGNANDAVVGMTRDAGGNIYVTGHTASTNFPVVPAAAAMPPAAQTMFGGGSASVGDAFVTKMNGSGTTIAYSTYLGGSGDDSGSGIRVDANGFAYVVGFTSSANFPVTAAANQAALAGARNAFIATVNPIGTQVVYASYHGGNGTDFAEKIAIDGSKNIYFTGSTTSSVFPTTAGVVQTALGGAQNAFAAKFDASAPAASLLPAMLAFGNQNLNTPSASQALTYTNSGNAALTITSIVASAGYSEVDNCAGMIAAGAFCTVNVTFQPTVAGPDPGTVTATDNAGGSPRVITLTGTGVATAPVATLLPAMLAFGNQRINTPSASKALTYTNSGNAALVIASIVASAGYSEVDNCAGMIAAGAFCTVNVTFQPTAAGPDPGTLTATDNAGGSPRIITLTGTGTAPIATLSTNALMFGNQLVGTTSAAQMVTLTNTGTDNLNLASVNQIGNNPGDFLGANNCPAVLAPAAFCTGTVSFKPSIVGAESATVQITDDSNGVAGSTQNVALTGTGTTPVGGTFTLSASTTTITVRRGQPATFAIVVTSVGGFNQSVALGCMGAPLESMCHVMPASVTPPPNAAVSDSVVVTTTAPSGILPQPRSPFGAPPALWGLLAAMIAALVMVMLPLPARARLRIAAPVVLLVGLSIFGAACGNSVRDPGTPLGPAVLTLTGTGNGQTQVLNLTLIVTQ